MWDLNRMTADEWNQVQGAKMMLRALPDFIRKWRSTDNKGKPTKNELSTISPSYDPKRPMGDDNNPFGAVRGVSTDMIIDAVTRLCAATYDCERFVHGDFPDYVLPHTDKKGKVTSIDFKYNDK